MAAINPKKVAGLAGKAGIKAPSGGSAPIKAGDVKKVGKLKKSPDQIKKEAAARKEKMKKTLLKMAIVFGTLLAIALIVYFVAFFGKQPKDAFMNAVDYAYKDKETKFREMFTSDTIAMVESDGSAVATQTWEKLMDGITPSKRPEVINQEITEVKDIKSAELTVIVDNEERKVHLRQEDGRWKINLNVAINPRAITLPDDIPPEYLDNFDISDEPDAWWEDESTGEGGKGSDGGSFLDKLMFWK